MNTILRSYTYDVLYIMADQLIKKYNPCHIYKDISGEAHCLRDSPSPGLTTLCCGGCKFLGPDGCTTKCLGCKLGLCEIAQEANPKLYELLRKMRDISWAYGLRGIRVSKRGIFDHLKHQSRTEKTYKSVMSNTIRDLESVLESKLGK